MHRDRPIGLLILLPFILVQTLIAQPVPGFRTFSYSTENGLPSNGIKGMEWDERSGFLWIATEAGISRFNGIEFTNFTKKNTPFISAERMRFMTRNFDEQIRAADMNGNAFAIRENKIRLLAEKTHKANNWENKLVGAAISDSVFALQTIPSADKTQFPFVQLIPLSRLSALLINPAGSALILNLRADTIRLLAQWGEDNESGFRIGDDIFIVKKGQRTIFRWDRTSDRLTPTTSPLPDENAKVFWETGMTHPITLSDRSAWRIDRSEAGLTYEQICDAIPKIGAIKYVQYSAPKQLLFLGSVSRGFVVIRTNRLMQLKTPGVSPDALSAYYSQWECSPGSVLTQEGHTIGAITNSLPQIRGKFGYSLFEDGDSLVWFSGEGRTGGGVLQCLDRRTGMKTSYDRIPIYDVFAFARWKEKILISNHEGTGFLQGDTIRFLYKKERSTLEDSKTFTFLPLGPDLVSMASCAGWIMLNLKTGRADTVLSLPGICIRTQVMIDGHVFIGTYGDGIFLYHNGTLRKMPLDKNSFLQYTHCFVPDTAGYVWISTNRGLFRARTSDMIEAFQTRRPSIYYHYYGRNDGIDMTELNGGCAPCAIKMRSGTISFPSMDGLVWADPRTAIPLLPDEPIYLDEIRIDTNSISELDFERMTIGSNFRNIYLRLGFSAWCNPENIYIDYQLDDTTTWIGLSVFDGSTIRLANLSPGKHRLRIRKRNGFGPDNFSYKSLSFHVGRRWFQHPMFLMGCLLLLMIIIYLFSRYQNRRLLRRQKMLEELINRKTRNLQEQNALLEKNNRINSRLISIISHDIVTPLKFLTVAGRGLKEKKDQLSNEIQEETIQEITDTAQELQLLSTNILNWIKYQSENQKLLPERIRPHEITQQVFSILAPLTKEKKLKLVNRIQEKLHITQFAEPLRVLIYNLVSNAIRYSDHGEIAVSLTKMKSEYLLSVSDQGIGMSREKIESLIQDTNLVIEKSAIARSGHGLGFLIIRDLVRWIGGRLDIASSPGKGTDVRVSFRQAGGAATDIE